MKLIKRIRNQMILTGVVCVGAYAAYQVLLTDEAKEQLSALGKTVRESYEFLADQVNQRIGTIMDEDLVSQNRANIRKQWEDLGF